MVEVEKAAPNGSSIVVQSFLPSTKHDEDENSVETSVGRSVTDGVIITAKLST